jgi:hypothetical protein
MNAARMCEILINRKLNEWEKVIFLRWQGVVFWQKAGF